MTKISPADHAILKILIAHHALTVEAARELVHALELHRVEDPEHCITDLLIERKLLKPSQVNALLAKVEHLIPEPASPETAPSSPSPHPATQPVYHRRRSSSLLPVFLGFIILCLAGLAVFIVIQQEKGKVAHAPTSPGKPAATNTVAPGAAAGKTESAEVSREEMRSRIRYGNTEELRMRLKTLASLEGEPRKKVDDLDELLVICSDPGLRKEIDDALATARQTLDAAARQAFDAREEEVLAAIDEGKRRKALEIYQELFEKFGPNALSGKIARAYEEARATVVEEVETQFSAGKNAYWEERFEAARKSFEIVEEIGTAAQVADARKWLAKIERRLARNADEAEARPAVAREDTDESEDADDSDEESSMSVLEQRVDRVRERLSDLLRGSAELSADGVLEITYDFEKKQDDDAVDWLPDIATADKTSPVRWTLHSEEAVAGATGVRISNAGAFRHKARLLPPIEMEVHYYPQNQFSPQNVVALCWTTEKGQGVATNLGLQTARVDGFKCAKPRPPRLGSVTGFQSYRLRLVVNEESFHGLHRGSALPPRKLPAKLTTGFCGLIFDHQIAGTIRNVKIRGRLDVDWALGVLEKK